MRAHFSLIGITVLLFGLSGCGGGNDGVDAPGDSASVTSTYTIGGSVSGLNGGSLTLLNNNMDALQLSTNGAFTFTTPVAFKTTYAVTVGTQPLWQFCNVSNGSGTATGKVTGIEIACSSAPAYVTTLAGSGAAGSADGTGTAATFRGPSGVTVDASGNVYVADFSNKKIRKITPAGVVTTLAGSGTAGSSDGTGTDASFNGPSGVTVDASGNVYVADYYNNKIRKITPAGVVTTLAGSGISASADGTGTAASFRGPLRVTVDASGNLYVAEYYNNKIRKITPAGVVTTLAGSGTAGGADGTGTDASFNGPSGVTVDANGNVYVADFSNKKIRKITPAGVVTTLAGSGAAGSADGTGTAASFSGPYDSAVDASGNLYVADFSNKNIRKITPAGVVTTLAGSGTAGSTDGTGADASFNGPSGVTVDASGNVYVADFSNNKIRKITPSAP